MIKKNFYSFLTISFIFFISLFMIKFHLNYKYVKQTYIFNNLKQKFKTKEFISDFYDHVVRTEGRLYGYGSNILYFKQPFISADSKTVKIIFLKKKNILKGNIKKNYLNLINEKYNVIIDYENVTLQYFIKHIIYLLKIILPLYILILFIIKFK